MQSDEISPLTGWINWFVVLLFGPLIAFVLADACGFSATPQTFQVILLVEVCLVSGGVIVLLLVRALGPLTQADAEARGTFRLPPPPPGSALEEATQRPAAWNARIQAYLRAVQREIVRRETDARREEPLAALLREEPVESITPRVDRAATARPRSDVSETAIVDELLTGGRANREARRPASPQPPQQQRRRPPRER